MRILVVIDDYFNKSNGMCISTQRFVNEFKQNGQDVRILSSSIGGQADYSVDEMIIPLFKGIIAKEGFHMAFPKTAVIKKAVAWADIVMIETPFPLSWQAAKLSKKLGKPVTATCHIFPGNITESLHINNKFFNGFFWWFFKQISFKNADVLLCPTQKVQKQFSLHGFKQKKFVVSNGISSKFVNNSHKEYIGKPFTVICIGRFSKEKHQETLIRALKLSQHAKQMKVIFAGKGPLQKDYQDLTNKLGLKVKMQFFAPEELRHILQKCDLVVHCADVEVEGMACMEAFAAGCVPVIADSPLPSTVDYALTSRNRFPFGDAKALTEQLDYWFSHPEELHQAQISYRIFAKKLSVHASGLKVIKILDKLVKDSLN